MPRRAAERELALEPRPRGAAIERWLYDQLRDAILAGRLAPGALLPATRELARQQQVARGTVVAAYARLASEGYVIGAVGRGTRVAAPLPEAFLEARQDLPPSSAPARPASLSRRGRLLAGSPFPLAAPAPARPFRPNQPDIAAFPLELWRRLAARRASARTMPGEGDAMGYRPLRQAIAAHLAAARGVTCDAGQIAIVASTQQALDLTARLLIDPGDAVWVENPGYPGARAVLRAAGARLVQLPVDAAGIDVEAGRRRAPGARLACVTPARQAPTGATLGLARRMSLLAWANAADAHVFEDDYDSEFRFAGKPLAALKSLDAGGRVLLAGTFSKLLFPSLRLAYVALPAGLVDAFAAALSLTARHAPLPSQIVLHAFMAEGHFGRHLRRMRMLYAERAEALADAATRWWEGLLMLPPITGGLDVAARFVLPIDDRLAAARALAAGIEARPLSLYGPAGSSSAGLVLGFAPFSPAAIRAGARRLAAVLERLD